MITQGKAVHWEIAERSQTYVPFNMETLNVPLKTSLFVTLLTFSEHFANYFGSFSI